MSELPNPANANLKPEKDSGFVKKLLFFGKFLFVGFIILLLFLPMGMIESLIRERHDRLDDANREITQTWGHEQVLGGPVLTVPYGVYIQQKDKIVLSETRYAHFLPKDLHIGGEVFPEIRYRGIFKIPLYRVDLTFTGNFAKPDFAKLEVPEANVFWDKAFLSVGIPDMRVIRDQIDIKWGGKGLKFGPGEMQKSIFNSGVQVAIPDLKNTAEQNLTFSFPLKLSGSEMLKFLPLGEVSTVSLKSKWKDPSFIGAYLPDSRKITQDGFEAEWKVLYLGRNYSQQWTDSERESANNGRDTTTSYCNEYGNCTTQTETIGNNIAVKRAVNDSAFGVSLVIPADTYQKTTRSAKYALLFILLTFTTFFLFETFNKAKIHPIQYLLVGLAMCMFYLLLLSISEYWAFALSYLIAASSVVLMIGLYSMTVLKSGVRGFIMMVILGGLYGYLYSLLQAQERSLLLGSVGLFLILGAIMFVTRKLDWYNLESGKKKSI